MRTRQQRTGDKVEQAAIKAAQAYFSEAGTTKGSGNVAHDGDIKGLPYLHVDCKGSEEPGKGRSVSKAEWRQIKAQARKRSMTPVHVGIDDDGELVALCPWDDLVVYVKMARAQENSTHGR